MAIAHDASSSGGIGSGTTVTWSHTCAGADRVLLVGIATESVAVSSVTFNGDALTLLKTASVGGLSAIRCEVWYRLAPDVATGNIVVTLASSAACATGATSYTGVHQDVPFGLPVGEGGFGSAVPSITVSSATGELVHGVVSVRTSTKSITAGAGQTSRWNRYAVAATSPLCAGSSEAGALSVVTSWTVDDATSLPYAIVGVPIRATGSGLQLLINDVDRTARMFPMRRALRLNLPLGAVWTADFPLFDTTTPAVTAYRPALDQVVIIRKSGVRIFRGQIVAVKDGPWGGDTSGVITQVTAKAGTALDKVAITKQYAAGQTLLAIVTDIVDTYLSDYGITLDEAMLTGPTLDDAVTLDGTAREALDYLSARTGWVNRLTADDVLEVFEPGTKTAAYSLTAANGLAYGPVPWEQTRAQYANRVTVRYGGEKMVTKEWSVTGDGATDTWTLEYQGAQTTDGHLLSGFVTDSDIGGSLPVGVVTTDPSAFYDYNPATNQMVRVYGDLPNTDTATMPYSVQFPEEVTEEDAAEIAANGVWQPPFAFVDATDIFDRDEAIAYAQGLLRNFVETPKRIAVNTRQGFELPGTSITLTFADRIVSGSHLITQVTAVDSPIANEMEYTFTCLEGVEAQQTSRTEQLKTLLASVGSGRTGGASGPSGGGTAAAQFLPKPASRYTEDVIANAGITGSHVELKQCITGLGGGYGPGVQYGRGYEVDPGTWVSFGVIDGFYAGGFQAWNVAYKGDNTLGYAMQMMRTAQGEYCLMPHLNSNTPGSTGGYLGDPYNLTGFTSVYRYWQAAAIDEVFARKALFERGRTVASGEWEAVTFAAGNFTGSGSMTWTLASGDQVTLVWSMHGKTMTLSFVLLTTTVGGTPAGALRIAIPGSHTAARRMGTTFRYSDNGTAGVGLVQTSAAGDAYIELFKDLAGTAWSASTDNTAVEGTISFEVQ